MLTRSRLRQVGWAVILGLCFALTIALTFRVNAVKSQVRLQERKIVALRMEKGLLETEFETRANQQQLRSLNEVEFGYQAPTAGQYLENERELAMLGQPSGPGAPEMIRVAVADSATQSGDSLLPAMVNPLTGKAMAAEAPPVKETPRKLASADSPRSSAKDANALIDRLNHVAKVDRADKPGRVEKLSHVEKTPIPLRSGLLKSGSLKAKGALDE